MQIRDKGIMGETHPFMKLVLLGFIVFFSLMIVLLIGSIVAIPFMGEGWLNSLMRSLDFSQAESINFLRYIQILSHLGMFIVPSIVFAWLVGRRIDRYFLLDRKTSSRSLILSVVVIIAAVPLINWLIELNMRMSLPAGLNNMEEWMRQAEDSAMEITELFLDVTTIQGLLFNIFMIAVIPAIGEELMFRGIVLRIFGQWSKSVHVAVWVSAILFSAMHMQFFGFLPRLFLGVLLGYLFVWGGSIWLPVLAHFINNAIAVTAYYLISIGYWDVDYDDLGKEATGAIYIIFSAIILGIILFSFYRKYKTSQIRES